MKSLKTSSITDAQIDAGGDLAVISSDLTSGKRNIYIRHPWQREKFFGRFRLDNGCVATSGDYERFFMHNGKRYHHILNPQTGLPAWACRSVTIKAPTTTQCDGLSTLVFVLGPDQGMELVEKLPEVEAIIIYENDGRLQYKISSGLRSIFIDLNDGSQN